MKEHASSVLLSINLKYPHTIRSAREQVRIVRAPRVKRVWGCIDTGYEWPATPESGRGAAGISNVTAANTLVNGFLELGRTEFGVVEVRELTGEQAAQSGGRADGEKDTRGGGKRFTAGTPSVTTNVIVVGLLFLSMAHPPIWVHT